MPGPGQLEIISPGGKIEFRELDRSKGIANIGRHPANDIVIDEPAVRLFHAVLDYRERPYQIVALSPEGETRVAGRPLPAKVATPLHGGEAVEIGGYTILLLADSRAAPGAPGVVALSAARPITLAPPLTAGPAPAATRAPQRSIDVATTISEDRWTVDVEQAATCELIIRNGSGSTATFATGVEGVDPSWVTISPSLVTLSRGGQATVTVRIKPPRLPASRAGTHRLTVVVTSPTYAGWRREHPATVAINPYYDFAVGEVTPREQTVSWSKPAAQATVAIVNKGNSDALFRLQGSDEARLCGIEFQTPGEAVSLARQVELRLRPGEMAPVRVRVAPPPRPLLGLAKRVDRYTLTVTLLAGAQPARSVLGEVRSAPWIGPGPIALLTLCLVALVGLLLQPPARPAGRIAEAMPPRASAPPFPLLGHDRTGPFAAPGEQPAQAAPEPPPAPPAGTVVLTYEQIFKEIAPRYGLDWRLLAAVAYQESRYNPLAVGKYGELGLMQIMPSTWDLMAPKVGVSDPWDPYSNALVSAAFLAFLRESFSEQGYSDSYWMLVGYNWGPANVRQLWKNSGGWDQVPEAPRRYALEVWKAASGPLPEWIEPYTREVVHTFGAPRPGVGGPGE